MTFILSKKIFEANKRFFDEYVFYREKDAENYYVKTTSLSRIQLLKQLGAEESN